MVSETSISPAIASSSLQDAPMRFASIGAKMGKEERDLTRAEKHCVFTISDVDVEDLSSFLTEKLQCLSKGSAAKLIGDESVNVEEILCGNVGVEEDGGDKRQSVCPNVTIGEDVRTDDRRFFADVGNNQILREELGSVNNTSTPKKAAWPIYTKRRSSVLGEQE